MHIKAITAFSFFDKGSFNWNLRPDVNFLSGPNRSGKTSLLYSVAASHKDSFGIKDLLTVWSEIPKERDLLYIQAFTCGHHDLKILRENVLDIMYAIDPLTLTYIEGIVSNFGFRFTDYLYNKVTGIGESIGELRMIHLILRLLLHTGNQPIIIDTPELGLDLNMQRLLIERIRYICPDCQIIVATHSPSIVGNRHDAITDITKLWSNHGT